MQVESRFIMLFCLLIFTNISLVAAGSDHSQLVHQLKPLVQKGCVLVADEDQALFRYPKDCGMKLIPASVMKIITASMALEKLGPDYRFRTEFYLSNDNCLGIRGYGDPFLVSEEWQFIAMKLAQLKLLPKKLKRIFVDDKAFSNISSLAGPGRSLNPYDAPNGALVSNFNTIHVRKFQDGRIHSAEPQTPLTPSSRRWARNLKPGIHRVSIPKNGKNSAIYSAELLRIFLQNKGYQFEENSIQIRKKVPKDVLIYLHQNSMKLTETISAMMLYSNNFIANQLLLVAGMKEYGSPAVPEKGVTVLRNHLLENLGLTKQDFHVVEGSGLSRENRMTVDVLWKALKALRPFFYLLPEEDGVRLKTGTLAHVYNLSGYLPGEKPLYFVIILNQKINSRKAVLNSIMETHRQNNW